MDIGIYGSKNNNLFEISDEEFEDYELIIFRDCLPDKLPDKFILSVQKFDPILIEDLNRRLLELSRKSIIIIPFDFRKSEYSLEFLKEALDNIKGVWVKWDFGETIVYGNGEYISLWKFSSIEHYLDVLEKEVKIKYYLLKRRKISEYSFTNAFIKYRILKKIINNLDKISKNFEVFLSPSIPYPMYIDSYQCKKLANLLSIGEELCRVIVAKTLVFNRAYYFIEPVVMLKGEDIGKEDEVCEEHSWNEFIFI